MNTMTMRPYRLTRDLLILTAIAALFVGLMFMAGCASPGETLGYAQRERAELVAHRDALPPDHPDRAKFDTLIEQLDKVIPTIERVANAEQEGQTLEEFLLATGLPYAGLVVFGLGFLDRLRKNKALWTAVNEIVLRAEAAKDALPKPEREAWAAQTREVYSAETAAAVAKARAEQNLGSTEEGQAP